MPALGDFVDVSLGFKSFLNDFFYVDQSTVKKFGIEKQFLLPLFMLADLDEDSFVQDGRPSRWLFACRMELADIANTGAGRYVNWGAMQSTELRKQTKEAVRWPKAPALNHQKHWYWPAAPVHPARLAVRKGIGSRYAPFVFKSPTLLDQRLYLLFPKRGVDIAVVNGYLASSLFPLSVETNADMGLGAGVLTLGTDALRSLPVLDLHRLSQSDRKKPIVKAATALLQGHPVNADQYPASKAIRHLDEAILDANGSDIQRAGELAAQVATLADSRLRKSRLRSVVRKASKRADLASVAEPIANEMNVWFRARRFPEDYVPSGPTANINLPAGPLVVSTEVLMDRCEVTISDSAQVTQYQDTLNISVAEVILRALQLGRRAFDYPTSAEQAASTLDGFDEFRVELELRLKSSAATTGLGSKYDDDVLSLVLDSLGIELADLQVPLSSREWEVGHTR